MSVLRKAIEGLPDGCLFAKGCDASLLLEDSAKIVSEKNAAPNKNSLRGFEVVGEIKLSWKQQNLIPFFKRQGLYEVDLVALSGGHTLGVARCVTYKQRLYNQNGNNQPDQTPEKNYFLDLKSACPRSGGDDNISPLDLTSPAKFDNSCFKLVLWGKGLLTSDEVLYTGKDGKTIQLVKRNAEDEGLFFEHFAKPMVKMGNISPLTGFNGEVRRNCRLVN